MTNDQDSLNNKCSTKYKQSTLFYTEYHHLLITFENLHLMIGTS